MQDRLYYRDAYIKKFESRIVDRGLSEDGKPYVILEETAFYPTGGGQPCDEGSINGIRVIDVEEVDGHVRHILSKALPEEVNEVSCELDWQRRFDHMQQHLGQHILSASFVELYDAKTVGFHLGKERVTIDIDVDNISEEMIQRVESLANDIVTDNRPIEAKFIEHGELDQYPLRKTPKVTENIRLVIVPDFDYNPCGGTHPAHTSEVGMIKILDWERNKNTIRIAFVCGLRALYQLDSDHTTVKKLKQLLSASDYEVTQKVERLIEEKRELEKTMKQWQDKLLEAEAVSLLNDGEKLGQAIVVSQVFQNRTIQDLQKLVGAIVSKSDCSIAFLAAQNDKIQFVFGRGKGVEADMNVLLKEILSKIDGKGGGTAFTAQGGGSSSISPQELLSDAMQLLKSRLSTLTVEE